MSLCISTDSHIWDLEIRIWNLRPEDKELKMNTTHSNPNSQIPIPKSLCTGSRRQFLWEMGAGFAGLALTGMLEQDGFFARHAYGAESTAATGSLQSTYLNPLAPKLPHFAAKAKHVIFLFMYGG